MITLQKASQDSRAGNGRPVHRDDDVALPESCCYRRRPPEDGGNVRPGLDRWLRISDQAESTFVERQGFIEVVDVDGNMVDSEGFHNGILADLEVRAPAWVLVPARSSRQPMVCQAVRSWYYRPSRGRGSVVEHHLAKVRVAGSNPVVRSKKSW